MTSYAENVFRNLWIGYKGTRTPIHHDPYDNMFIQIAGLKQFLILTPQATVDASNPDQCPTDISHGNEQIITVLKPGDAIFVPRRWWHRVIGVCDNVSLSFWF